MWCDSTLYVDVLFKMLFYLLQDHPITGYVFVKWDVEV